MHKGDGKRSNRTSSSDDSPPKGATGFTPGSSTSLEQLEVDDPILSKHSPSKLEKIARHHAKTRSSIIKNMTKDQVADVGCKVFQRWAGLREKYRKKPATKKTKVSIEEDPEGSSFTRDETEPPLMELVSEEMENIDESRFQMAVAALDNSTTESDDSDEFLRADGWERYLFRKECSERHKALRMFAVLAEDSAHMLKRLTEALSEMETRMSEPSSPTHNSEDMERFLEILNECKLKVDNSSDEVDPLPTDSSESPKLKSPELKSPECKKPETSTDDEMSTQL